MKPIKITSACLLIVLLLALFSGCGGTPQPAKNTEEAITSNTPDFIEPTDDMESSAPDLNETRDYIKEVIGNRYVVNDVDYQIIEVSAPGQLNGPYYYYKIFSVDKVFAESIKEGVEPKIDSFGDRIVKLLLAYGSNDADVQYFDLRRDRTSEVIRPYSNITEYFDDKTAECLVAYFDWDRNAILIKDVFDEQGFSTEIDRNFIRNASCNQMIFLNENQIYLDYDTFADGYSNDDLIAGKPVEFRNVWEIVTFR